MKTISTLFLAIVLSCSMAFAQGNDTLLFMDFNDSTIVVTDIIVGPPNGNDPNWVNFDADQLPDASGAGRPDEWFWSPEGFATDDTTGVMFANSWLGGSTVADNWLITPGIEIIDNTAQLHWKSAPRQTPRFMDGYHVLVSTTDNLETSFTDTLMLFAEYLLGSGNPTPGWTNYTFSPGYVHGQNGTYIEFNGDSGAYLGVLEPHTLSLAQYSGQTIYIAFRHRTTDDNLISIDDIMVTGTLNTGISENSSLASLGVYPNPAIDNVQVTYELRATTPIVSTLYDVTGKKVKEIARSLQMAGKHHFILNVQNLSSGTYFIELKTPKGSITQKLVVE
ncbi:MAG: choice-of-anchor J domain-containing protein [Bacteroidia bacterium]